jgi:hypothetical protein
MSGYFTQDGTDLSNIFKPISSQNLTVINSTNAGITITSNSGPLIIQQNTLTQPINMITAVASTATINLSQNSIPIISVKTREITIKSPSNTTVMVINDISGAICSTNFNYGTANITPTASSTYVLTVSSPKELYITGTNSFTLTFPTNPPNGTNYRIIRSANTGTITLSGGTFYDGTNAVITSITSYMMKFVYYSGAWYTCRF